MIKRKFINNTVIKYVEPLLDDINHPELIQERKLNLDSAAYEKKIYANVHKTSAKK